MIKALLTLLFTGLVHVQNPGNLIEWSNDRKLTWNDFQGQAETNSVNAALTSSSIKIDFGYNRSGFTYTIRCLFNKQRSWGRVKNEYILAHEQGHFDIAEIHARKLHKALRAYRFNSRTVNEDISAIYDRIMKEHNAFQSTYDEETDHSRLPEKQREWLGNIDSLLNEYSGYRNYRETN